MSLDNENLRPDISVVVATYNRTASLKRMMRNLESQSVDGSFELVIVDDGSADPVPPQLEDAEVSYPWRCVRQDNTGQAGARQHGAELAEGEIIVIVDDDMELPEDFLAAHLAAHRGGCDVVLGYIKTPVDANTPLFERFHLDQLERYVRGVRDGDIEVRGVHLCTGNVSFRRSLFFQVGGFDRELKRSEDRDLGVRFERAGANLGFEESAVSLHRTDHTSLDVWLDRAFKYGVYDEKIAKKYPDQENADPWSFLWMVNPVSRPLLVGTIVAPGAGEAVARLAMEVALLVDKVGLERVALKGATLVYGLEYFRGLRAESGSVLGAARGFSRYMKKRLMSGKAPLSKFVRAVEADYRWLGRHRSKYFDEELTFKKLPADAVTKIGFQMTLAIRVMQLVRDAGVPLAPQVVSRLIRHLYSAEIHWDADIRPGLAIVHGNGLVISHAARIDEGCILFHNVTLGEGVDPETRAVGGPHLEPNVHIGPGATITGPITVGEGTKIVAGATLMETVPERSLVSPGEPVISARSSGNKGRGIRVASAPKEGAA